MRELWIPRSRKSVLIRRLRNAFHPPHQAVPDLSTNQEPARRATPLGPTKLESTVRYLGIDVEDALELAEQTEA